MASSESYTGSVDFFAGNFAPENWCLCNGQILNIGNYAALYSIIGDFYGGDGRVTFRLPDMQGRVPIGAGTNKQSNTTYYIGSKDGLEKVQLTVQELPAHNHLATFAGTGKISSAAFTSTSTGVATIAIPVQDGSGLYGTSDKPFNNYLGPSTINDQFYADSPSTTTLAPFTAEIDVNVIIDVTMNGLDVEGTVVVGPTGNSQPFKIMQPYTVLNCIICMNGVYPPRS